MPYTIRRFVDADAPALAALTLAAIERAGFQVQHRRDFAIDLVAIHNDAMEMRLDE